MLTYLVLQSVTPIKLEAQTQSFSRLRHFATVLMGATVFREVRELCSFIVFTMNGNLLNHFWRDIGIVVKSNSFQNRIFKKVHVLVLSFPFTHYTKRQFNVVLPSSLFGACDDSLTKIYEFQYKFEIFKKFELGNFLS